MPARLLQACASARSARSTRKRSWRHVLNTRINARDGFGPRGFPDGPAIRSVQRREPLQIVGTRRTGERAARHRTIQMMGDYPLATTSRPSCSPCSPRPLFRSTRHRAGGVGFKGRNGRSQAADCLETCLPASFRRVTVSSDSAEMPRGPDCTVCRWCGTLLTRVAPGWADAFDGLKEHWNAGSRHPASGIGRR